MTVVSTKTFLENPIHFFNLARKEDVAVKRGKFTFRIMLNTASENPSPSGDSYWADQRNVDELKRRVATIHSGAEKSTPLDLSELKVRMGL